MSATIQRLPLALGLLGVASLSLEAATSSNGTSPNGATSSVAPLIALGGGTDDIISFEGLAAGTVVDSVFSEGGAGPITVLGDSPAFPAQNAAIIFDSANPTGEDPDLGTPNEDFAGPGVGAAGEAGSPFQNDTARGNVLILAEDLVDANDDDLIDDPDDADIPGATLTFTFPFPAIVKGITVIDVEEDEQAPTITFFDGNDTFLGQQVLPQPGDNGVAVIGGVAAGNVVTLVLTLNGSGAFDEIVFAAMDDCNGNLIADEVDIETGFSQDCNGNEVPDECEDDCNGNGIPDDCDVDTGFSDDCNGNGTPDECEDDCNRNGTPDDCDVQNGTSTDFNGNGIPDECEPCDENDLSVAGTWKLDNGSRLPFAGLTLNRFRPAGGERVTLDFEDDASCVWMVTDDEGLVCIFGNAMRLSEGGPTGELVYLEFCYQNMNPFGIDECDKVGRRETGAPLSVGPMVGFATWLDTGESVDYNSKSVSNGTFMELSTSLDNGCDLTGSGWLMATEGDSTGDWFFGIPCE